MRYTTTQYATALMQALTHAPSMTVARRFVALLQKHGIARKKYDIIEKARELVRMEHGGKVIRITAATETTARTIQSALAHPSDDVATTIEPGVNGGASITINNIRFDGTLERRFAQLEKTLTE